MAVVVVTLPHVGGVNAYVIGGFMEVDGVRRKGVA